MKANVKSIANIGKNVLHHISVVLIMTTKANIFSLLYSVETVTLLYWITVGAFSLAYPPDGFSVKKNLFKMHFLSYLSVSYVPAMV